MSCSTLFYSKNDEETLHERLMLSDPVKAKGIARKDELIEFLRVELREAFDCDVKFWIQGSYKSCTLIKPVDRYSSYDIDVDVDVDVGVYLFFDAESEDINDECELQEPKNACEGLKFKSFLTIDTPIYYIAEDKVKLATDDGWVGG